MTTTDFISLVSLLISSIALIYTYITNTKKYELNYQYRREILSWYSETIGVLIRLKHEAQIGQTNIDLKTELLSNLSKQIEIGRFYFPNVNKGDLFGNGKPKAYQGYRNLLLDFLVFSYRLFEMPDSKKYLSHIEYLTRNFTSLLFETINPKEFLKATEKNTNQVFIKNLSFEDFLEQQPELIKFDWY